MQNLPEKCTQWCENGPKVAHLRQKSHFWPQIDKLNSPKLNYWTLTSHYYDGKIKILDLMMIGYDYAVAGHKATFSGARPLLRALGHFSRHKANFRAQGHFSGHKVTFPSITNY